MKIFMDGSTEIKVARCPAGLYIMAGLPFLQYPTANKDVAEAFLSSWAIKRQLPCKYCYDIDMYPQTNNFKLCKNCAKGLTNNCGVYEDGKLQIR